LVLFCQGDNDPVLELPLDPRRHRTGDVWHALIEGLNPEAEYGYRLWREPNPRPEIHRFDPERVMLDPWTRLVTGGGQRCAIATDDFDWNYDQPLNTPLADSIIYELHVRGFTKDTSSGVSAPGTFAGLAEKIPYLRELGITAVELLPVHEFDQASAPPGLTNFWGYQPLAFFAPHSGYAEGANPAIEFKKMVRAFHEAGIEVILDVVFNHTAAGALNGIDNSIYYLIDRATGGYLDYSGTGNTLNCNHPVVRDMIRNCLRYWVMEMHVDGFRFDLASILGRGQDGSVLLNPPLLESLAHDPILGQTKLIAEAWDAAGLYQVGKFPAWSRWAEWNGRYRDDLRRFVRGDSGMVPVLAQRLTGSPDLYASSEREPYHSINFVTCHDGFTLADLVSYNRKHNEANLEGNRDGADENYSWNCGAEGAATDESVQALRDRQMKNFIALLLVSHGVPMLLGGDEFARTQHGNNNAYCQDNEMSWIDWRGMARHAELLRFTRKLIRFRSQHSILRRRGFNGEDVRVAWHGVRLHLPDWSWDSRSLAMQIRGTDDDIYVIANAWHGNLQFELPPDIDWTVVADTSGRDAMPGVNYEAQGRSVVILEGRRNVPPLARA